RLLLLGLLYALSVFYVMRYATKIKEDPAKSFMKEVPHEYKHANPERDDQPLSRKQKWVLGLFIFTFLMMVVGLVPWSSINENWTFFEDVHAWFSGLPFAAVLIGEQSAPLGTWYFQEITMLFFLMAVIIGLVVKMPEEEIVTSF